MTAALPEILGATLVGVYTCRAPRPLYLPEPPELRVCCSGSGSTPAATEPLPPHSAVPAAAAAVPLNVSTPLPLPLACAASAVALAVPVKVSTPLALA